MKGKTFFIPAEAIKPGLAPRRGACMASDRITVDGLPVGFMYREPPESGNDSGWCFLAGDEVQEYVENPDNFEIYDVNTIANYDHDIIPMLDAAVGSAFERRQGVGPFIAVPFPDTLNRE